MSYLPLYEQVLGPSYDQLPPAVKRFHRLAGRTVLHGWVETHASSSWGARLLAYCLGAPSVATHGPLRFELDATPEAELWVRHFPTKTMSSRMRLVGGQLEERLGAARLTFRLTATGSKLSMRLTRMRFLGVPCPTWLLPQVIAEEAGAADQLQFTVAAALPFGGVVASYRGHLEVSPKEVS